jgi:hypothetical protein
MGIIRFTLPMSDANLGSRLGCVGSSAKYLGEAADRGAPLDPLAWSLL